ncbi:MAG: hypothetical protein R6U98_32295, partial [Pirellulaceae bacterium]
MMGLQDIFQAVGLIGIERCPTQAVLPLVGLAADTLIRDRYISGGRINRGLNAAPRKPSSRWSDSRRTHSSATGIIQAVGLTRIERCPTQAVLPLVGLAADTLIRDRYNSGGRINPD